MDDFILLALAAGIGVSLVAGPLGCFVVWRRMSYFGATLAHSALLGIALGLLFGIDVNLGVVFVCIAVAALVVLLDRDRRLATDTLLGILAHGALAFGVVALALVEEVRIDLMGYLFGDILAVGKADLAVIWGGGAVVAVLIGWRWQALVTSTVSEDLAFAAGIDPKRERLILMLALALVVAVALKVVGALLIGALLLLPMTASAEEPAIAAADAYDVHQAHCASVAGGSTQAAAESMAEVTEVWQRVITAYEASGRTYLLYWRGVLGEGRSGRAGGHGPAAVHRPGAVRQRRHGAVGAGCADPSAPHGCGRGPALGR